MFAAVLERRWEMGLQRTLGMAAAQLRRTILLESGAIGFLGGAGGILAGFMLGFLFTRVMQAGFAWRIPFIVRPSLAGGGIIGTVAIAGLSGLYPSRLAARGEIVRALRYE